MSEAPRRIAALSAVISGRRLFARRSPEIAENSAAVTLVLQSAGLCVFIVLFSVYDQFYLFYFTQAPHLKVPRRCRRCRRRLCVSTN